jgi:hypothetical protein
MRGILCTGLTLVAALVLTGCESSPGTLTGKVTYQGKPLKGGNILFYTKKRPVSVPIQPDGTYKAENVPGGEAKVTVETESLKPTGEPPPPTYKPPPGSADVTGGYNPAAAAARTGANYVAIPKKYSDKETTPLTVTVTGGPQTYDIKLD